MLMEALIFINILSNAGMLDALQPFTPIKNSNTEKTLNFLDTFFMRCVHLLMLFFFEIPSVNLRKRFVYYKPSPEPFTDVIINVITA